MRPLAVLNEPPMGPEGEEATGLENSGLASSDVGTAGIVGAVLVGTKISSRNARPAPSNFTQGS